MMTYPVTMLANTIQRIISSDAQDLDIHALIGSPSRVVNVEVIINAGVTISASSTANAALISGTMAAGSKVKIINNGTIAGLGGAGGHGGGNGTNGSVGGNGGDAINTTVPLIIDNTNGNIYGGGGGGGGGGSTTLTGGVYKGGSGGGGGQGSGTSFGGGTDGDVGWNNCAEPAAGSNGSSSGPGAGGVDYYVYNNTCVLSYGGGGSGGSYGQNGSSGHNATQYSHTAGGAGGQAGKAINLNGNTIVWLAGNNSTQVKGVVS